MNNISPNAIADFIYHEFDYFTPPASLSGAILEYAYRFNNEFSTLEIAESIGENLEKYISSLLKKEQERRRANLFCPYQIFVDQDEIVGFAYPRLTDSSIMEQVRKVASEVPKALEVIQGLHHSKFEVFCSKILDLLHADETQKTTDSRDEGIDFLGWLCIPETFSNIEAIPQFRKEFRLLVIGQAKKYKPENPVGVNAIRELIGTVAAFHHDQLAPWQSRLPLSSFRLMSPILPLMMTTGRISSDAKKLAEKCGVVVRDGAEIALFICLEKIGLSEIEENGVLRFRFDEEKFMVWLNEPKA